jgi:hypothetical protein
VETQKSTEDLALPVPEAPDPDSIVLDSELNRLEAEEKQPEPEQEPETQQVSEEDELYSLSLRYSEDGDFDPDQWKAFVTSDAGREALKRENNVRDTRIGSWATRIADRALELRANYEMAAAAWAQMEADSPDNAARVKNEIEPQFHAYWSGMALNELGKKLAQENADLADIKDRYPLFQKNLPDAVSAFWETAYEMGKQAAKTDALTFAQKKLERDARRNGQAAVAGQAVAGSPRVAATAARTSASAEADEILSDSGASDSDKFDAFFRKHGYRHPADKRRG